MNSVRIVSKARCTIFTSSVLIAIRMASASGRGAFSAAAKSIRVASSSVGFSPAEGNLPIDHEKVELRFGSHLEMLLD